MSELDVSVDAWKTSVENDVEKDAETDSVAYLKANIPPQEREDAISAATQESFYAFGRAAKIDHDHALAVMSNFAGNECGKHTTDCANFGTWFVTFPPSPLATKIGEKFLAREGISGYQLANIASDTTKAGLLNIKNNRANSASVRAIASGLVDLQGDAHSALISKLSQEVDKYDSYADKTTPSVSVAEQIRRGIKRVAESPWTKKAVAYSKKYLEHLI